MKKILAIMLAAMLLFSAAAFAEDTIKIGVFEPLTGSYAGGGAMEVEGIELAHEMYPEVLGKQIELVKADSESDKVEASMAAQSLVDAGVVAVLGGLLLGFVEIMLVAAFPALSGYRDAFAFVLLIVVLLVKPTGLMGEKTTEKV